MGRTNTRIFAALLSAAMVIAATGCGSSSKTSTAPNTPEQLKADEAVARQAVLTLGDLPTGHEAKPHKPSSGDDIPKKVEQKFLACTHLPKRFIDDTNDSQPNADSPDFSKGEIATGAATEIESSVEIDRSSKDISEPLAYLKNDSVPGCFQPFFHAALAAGLKDDPRFSVRSVTVKSIPAGSAGDEGAGFQGRMAIGSPIGTIVVFFDMFFVRSGRAGVTLLAIGFREPVGLDLEHELLATMVGRLENTT
jgi:hypothetical protein